MNVKPLDPKTVPFVMIRLAGKNQQTSPGRLLAPQGCSQCGWARQGRMSDIGFCMKMWQCTHEADRSSPPSLPATAAPWGWLPCRRSRRMKETTETAGEVGVLGRAWESLDFRFWYSFFGMILYACHVNVQGSMKLFKLVEGVKKAALIVRY